MNKMKAILIPVAILMLVLASAAQYHHHDSDGNMCVSWFCLHHHHHHHHGEELPCSHSDCGAKLDMANLADKFTVNQFVPQSLDFVSLASEIEISTLSVRTVMHHHGCDIDCCVCLDVLWKASGFRAPPVCRS